MVVTCSVALDANGLGRDYQLIRHGIIAEADGTELNINRVGVGRISLNAEGRAYYFIF